jgi:hypothetical protein
MFYRHLGVNRRGLFKHMVAYFLIVVGKTKENFEFYTFYTVYYSIIFK